MKLRSILLDSVGYPEARFTPLRLDFTNGVDPVDTVVWLDNGGGKTSLSSLVFNALRPHRNDFIARIRDGYQLEDYVLGSDTAHIVHCFDIHPPGELVGHQLVVGEVLEWRDRRATPDDVSRLQRSFYCFRADDLLNIDTLPIFDDDGRRRSMKEFTGLLRELAAADASRELVVTGDQRSWMAQLQRRHIDPELLRHQLVMNAEEGGATQLLSFDDAWDFAELLVKLLVADHELNAVRGTVNQLRDKWDKLAGNRAELDLCLAALPVLDTAVAAHRRCDAATDTLRDRTAQAVLLRRRLGAAVDTSKRRHDRLRGRAEELDREETGHRRALDRAEASRRQARFEEARLIAEVLEADRDAAEEAAVVAASEADAWDHVDTVVERDDLDSRLQLVRAQLQAGEDEADPLRHAVAQAEVRLAGRLAADRRDHVAAAAAADDRTAELQGRIDDLDERRSVLTRQIAAATQRIEAAATATARADELLAAHVTDGRVAVGESAVDADSRWAEAADAAQADRDTADADIARVTADKREHTRARSDADTAAARLTEQVSSLERTVENLSSRRDDIAADDAVRDLLDGFAPQLPAGADELLEAADSQAAALQQTADEHQRIGDELTRRLDRIDDEGIETDSDAATARDLLHAAGIPAVSGWEYLAGAALTSDQRHQLLHADPAAAAGVVLTADDADVEAARAVLAELVPSVPVVVAPRRNLGTVSSADRAVLLPQAERYDRDAAAVLVAKLTTELEERQQAARADRTAAAVRSVSARTLRRWLDDGGRHLPQTVDKLAKRRLDRDEHLQRSEDAVAALELLDHEEAEAASRRSAADGALQAAVARRQQLARAVAAAEDAQQQRIATAGEASVVRSWAAEHDHVDAELSERRRDAVASTALAAQQRAEADQIADEAVDMALTLDGVEPIEDLPARPTLRDAVRRTRKELDQATPDPELQRQVDDLARDLAALDQKLVAAGGSAGRARELARSADASQPSSRIAARKRARADATAAGRRHATLQEEARAARERSDGLAPTDRVRFADLSEYGPLVTADDARALADSFDEDAERVRAQLEATREKADAAREDARKAETLADRLVDHVARLDDALGANDVGEGEIDTDGLAWTGSADQAKEAVTGSTSALRAAADDLEDAQRELETERTRLLGIAEAHPDARRETRLALDRRTVDTDGCAELAHDLQLRADHLRSELASAHDARAVTITRLDQITDDVLAQLNKVERQSRIPDSITEWAGIPFIRIKYAKPPADAMREKVAHVVDGCLTDGVVPDGRDLVMRTLKQVLGADGLRIDLLKPTDTMEPKRMPVERFAASDGQKLTAAIMLYCTIARTRFDKLGLDPALAGGMLWLDNPFGKATKVDLVDLQRQVADKMGIQLIYLTGVKDYDAISAFTNRENLQKAHNGAGHTHVVRARLFKRPDAA